MRDLDNHFGGYNHLAHLPRAADALHTLRKAASCVKPLMRKRGWRVGVLSEFVPEQANLLGLNINRGEQIQIRLRYAGDLNQFLPFDQVLDTLLHELSHNVWGPHDEKFHKLWNELRDEWETLQIKGFTGEAFLGNGQSLGGNRIPVDEVRRRARAAAEDRAKLNKNKFNPGHRLGGGVAAPPQSRRRLRDVLATAAQSRSKASTTKVDSGCATGTQAGTKAADDALRNGFRTNAEMDDANSIAIAKALQELYEQEEDNRIFDGLAGPPAPGGLTWDPELGLQAMKPPLKPAASSPPAMSSTKGSQQRNRDSASTPVPSVPPGSSRQSRPSVPQVNAHGRPVSRLVREAESRGSHDHEGISETPAFQNWPVSGTGANFGTGHDPAVTPTSTARPTSSSSDVGSWGCPQCTFHNHASMNKCEICDTSKAHSSLRRPVPSASYGSPATTTRSTPLGWACNHCGTFMETQWWTCSQCGMMKNSS